MSGRQQDLQRIGRPGDTVVEPIELHANIAGLGNRGAVLNMVTGESELHPRERDQRQPGPSP